MSLDHPEYLVLREKSRPLGWLWRIGDTGYYLGLLFLPLFGFVVLGRILLGLFNGEVTPGRLYFVPLASLVLGFVILLGSSWLKEFALIKGGVVRS
jgi:hypothetical protein